MAKVDDVAAAILEKHGSMSTWKLQKLVYYAQAWHLVWEERPLFEDTVEAWANGPVVRSLYDQHRGSFTLNSWPRGRSRNLTEEERTTVEGILDVYGKMSAADLSALMHRERPWLQARRGLEDGERGNQPITHESMAEYYGGLV